MKRICILIFVFCIFGCFAEAKSQTNFQVNITSAKKYLDMAQNATNGNMPTDADWEALFASPAYSKLFTKVSWDKTEFEDNVRNAFEIVYDSSKSAICDSIAKQLDIIELSTLDTELPLFVSTALNIKRNLKNYIDIINSLDIDDVIDKANSLALSLLPNQGVGLTPETCPIYFIVWDLECRALGDALFLDVNTFFTTDYKLLQNLLRTKYIIFTLCRYLILFTKMTLWTAPF
jgi:hypothetical protein